MKNVVSYGAFLICAIASGACQQIDAKASGPPIDSNKLLLPAETVMLIKDDETDKFTAIAIYPDPIPNSSIAYVSIWSFPDAKSFYSLVNSDNLPGMVPQEKLKNVSHNLISVQFGDIVPVGEKRFRWHPNTRRSSFLEQLVVGDATFAIWRLHRSAPSENDFLKFREAAEKHNKRSLKLGSVPVGGRM